MDRVQKVLAAVAALTLSGVAQTPMPGKGPPACEVSTGVRTMPRPSARPSSEQIQEVAEQGAADPTVLIAAEPIPNFGVARFRLADYAECVKDSGCYWSDLDAQTRRAEAVLDRAIASKRGSEKLAVVLDIDETSLSSYCELKSSDFGFLAADFSRWVATPQAAVPIPGTLRLYNKARAAGLDVFFITGRSDDLRDATVKNLELAGFKGWKGLALRVGAQRQMATMEYKGEERRKILDAGYRIVLNMGDQWSDLNGQARGETSVKLPNPFYYLP